MLEGKKRREKKRERERAGGQDKDRRAPRGPFLTPNRSQDARPWLAFRRATDGAPDIILWEIGGRSFLCSRRFFIDSNSEKNTRVEGERAAVRTKLGQILFKIYNNLKEWIISTNFSISFQAQRGKSKFILIKMELIDQNYYQINRIRKIYLKNYVEINTKDEIEIYITVLFDLICPNYSVN